MNGLKIRKLAAVVAGAALFGAAVAPMASALTSTEVKSVVYDASMSPVANIVVGQNAHVSDGVWAGNIARKVVEKAVVQKTWNGTGSGSGLGTASVTDLAAKLSIGGTVTVSGGKTFDSSNLNSISGQDEYGQSITQDPLAFLKDESVSYKFNGSSETIDVKETIGVRLDAKFNTDDDVRDLTAEISAGDVNYVLSLGAGIPIGSTSAATADFSDGSDDNVRIPFFGKTYLVQTVDITSARAVSEVRLIEDKAKQTFVAGETFTMQGKGLYTGQTLTVTVVSVVATGPAASSYQAKFNLTDASGSLIDTQTVSAGNFVDFEDAEGDEVVSGDIYVDTASLNTGTNEGTVDLLVGTSSVRLLDGENYPYNEQVDEDNVDGPYDVTLVESTDTNKLTSIVIANQQKDVGDESTSGELVDTWGASVFDDDTPLYSKWNPLTEAGEDGPSSFSFLDGTGALGEDFFSVTFNGFENDEELTHVSIGDNTLVFRDAQDSSHEIPFWFKQDQVTGSAVNDGTGGKKFTFDGTQELWYDLNTSTTDFNVSNGAVLNGATITYAASTNILTTDLGAVDLNNAPTAVILNGITYTFSNGDANAQNGTTVGLRADGYLRVATSELDSDVSASDLLNGLAGATAITGTQFDDVFFYDDANVNSSTIGVSTAPILLPLAGDNYNVAYSYFVSESGANSTDDGVYFLLAGNPGYDQHASSANVQRIPNAATIQNTKQIAFLGTDVGEDGTIDRNFYFPQIDDLGQDDGSTTVYSSIFGVDENGTSSYSARVYIDNQTDALSNTDDTDIAVPVADVNYGWSGFGINGVAFSLDYEDADSLEAAYTDWGTKIDITDNKSAVFWIPQNRPSIEFVVTGASSSTTVTGGESITVEEGETGTFTTGTSITVEDITYTATVVPAGTSTSSTTVTSGTSATYWEPAPLNGKAMVYTTQSMPAGNKIVVGGPLVNSLANSVSDRLNASGDVVAEVSGSNIIVAGYTAEDTGAAAQMLITALDAI